MQQREAKFRAMFKNMDTGRNVWITIGVNERYDQPGWAQVSPWVQYTGLLDSVGNEIYERDILDEGGNVFEVGWIQEDASWNFDIRTARKCEVIGNVFEHPELLK